MMCYMENCKAENDIQALKVGFQNLTVAFNRLTEAIAGNDLGSEGIVGTVKRLNEEQVKMKEDIDGINSKITWASGFSAALGAGVGFVSSILTLK